jgi:archaellum biogenesis ATPase FlaH
LQRHENSDAQVEQLISPAMDTVEGESLSWLWPGRIAVGTLCVIAGDPGLGKSLITLDIAARVSAGQQWPDGTGTAPTASVMLLNAEDSYAATVRPRLEAAGANLKNIRPITGVGTPGQERKHQRCFDLSTDLEILADRLRSLREPRLLVIDPVSSYLGSVSENANAEIRDLLRPLGTVADETNTAVILVTHLRKAAGSNLHRVIGSIAIAAVARTGYVALRANDHGARVRKLVPIKMNLAEDSTAIRYRVHKDESSGQPVIVWDSVVEHDEIEMPTSRVGRPSVITHDHLEKLEHALREGPKTIPQLMMVLNDPEITKQRLQQLVRERYRWLDKKQGQAGYVALPEEQPTD